MQGADASCIFCAALRDVRGAERAGGEGISCGNRGKNGRVSLTRGRGNGILVMYKLALEENEC